MIHSPTIFACLAQTPDPRALIDRVNVTFGDRLLLLFIIIGRSIVTFPIDAFVSLPLEEADLGVPPAARVVHSVALLVMVDTCRGVFILLRLVAAEIEG